MKRAVPLATLGFLVALVPPAAAQHAPVDVPKTWVSGSIGGVLDAGRVPDAPFHWDFGTGITGSVGVHRQLGQALQLGVQATMAPSVGYELVPSAGTGETLRGNGSFGSGLATARLRTGGFDAFSLYLTGGAGAFVYRIPDLDRFEPDLALFTGAGIEYRTSPRRSIFLEWGRYTTYHKGEGVKNNTVRHSKLQIGGRIGL